MADTERVLVDWTFGRSEKAGDRSQNKKIFCILSPNFL